VITDVIIQNEKDVPPPGYVLIERTLDSSLSSFFCSLHFSKHADTHTRTCSFCLNRPFIPQLLQVGLVPKSKLLGIVVTETFYRTDLRFGSHSFRVCTIHIELSPHSVCSCKSLTMFRRHLKTLFSWHFLPPPSDPLPSPSDSTSSFWRFIYLLTYLLTYLNAPFVTQPSASKQRSMTVFLTGDSTLPLCCHGQS